MPEYQTRKQKRGKDRGNGKLLHRRGQQDVAADDRGELHQIPVRDHRPHQRGYDLPEHHLGQHSGDHEQRRQRHVGIEPDRKRVPALERLVVRGPVQSPVGRSANPPKLSRWIHEMNPSLDLRNRALSEVTTIADDG